MKKLSYYFFTLAFALTSSGLFAQHKCGTTAFKNKKMQDPAIAQKVADLEVFTQNWIQNEQAAPRELVTLPVVVHVLYTNDASNISEAQIQSQFEVLNEDFRKLNADFSNTPEVFQAVAADSEIEFCLASVDPQGNPTSGITRTEVSGDFDYENDYYDPQWGGHAAWDNTKYINVWIGDLESIGLLGFASPPETADEDDGIVVTYQAWGNTGTLSAPNDLGRTATHEFGHYFNLEHVWGDGDSGCDIDDFVADTPPQFEAYYGCDNTFPLFDDCTASGNGVMFNNFMDYGDDACLTLFTEGQKARMLAALNGPRAGLLSSQGCGTVATSNSDLAEVKFEVSPNPANSFLTIKTGNEAQSEIDLLDVAGRSVLQTSLQAGNQSTTVNVASLKAGIYFVRLSSENKVGVQKIIITK